MKKHKIIFIKKFSNNIFLRFMISLNKKSKDNVINHQSDNKGPVIKNIGINAIK